MSIRFSKTLLLPALIVVACTQSEKPIERETVDAPVIVVQRASLPSYHSVAGTVRSETTSTLAANVVGTVTRVHVGEGDRVRAGDLLVEIESREPRAQVDRARAGRSEVERAIEAARANAQLADATYRRYDALRERGSASQQEYDEAKARRTAAQAELDRLTARRDEARAAATQAEAVLDFSRVRSPMDGVVTTRFVDPGAQAAPGVPLVSIESADAMRIDTNVPESVPVRAGDRAVVMFGDREIAARVTRVQPSVDAAARSALVKLQLEGPSPGASRHPLPASRGEGSLRVGAYVKVLFPTGARDAVSVPQSALVQRGQLTSVFVVGSDRIARMRLITIGATAAGRTEVLSGLAEGEQIITAPARVRDGVVVRASA
jgi:RND family efflux transporter MFP subunit